MLVTALVIILIVALVFLFYASYSIKSNVYLRALCRMNVDERVVGLTFDDGPTEKTIEVLKVLRSRGIKATFFLVGERALDRPDLVKQIVADGHQIGIHTMHHRWSFPFGNKRRVKEDLRRTREVLEQITGQSVEYFRPPFGVTNPNIGVAVHELGLRTIGWSIRSYDTKKKTPREEVTKRIERKLRPGAIILLHDDREKSDVLLQQVLEMLTRNNYEVVPIKYS